MHEFAVGLLIAAALALLVYCLVESVEAPPSRVRALPVPVWRLLILVPLAGPVAWLLLGRPRAGHRIDAPNGAGRRRRESRRDRRATAPRAGHASAGSLRTDWPVEPLPDSPRLLGPDDDPDFIAHLAEVVRQDRRNGGRTDAQE